MAAEVLKPFRYDDAARELDESLAAIELTPIKVASSSGGLDRIAAGETALKSLDAERAAAIASVPQELQKALVKNKLQKLLGDKHVKKASRDRTLDVLVERIKRADPTNSDLILNAGGYGSGAPVDDKPSEEKRQGVHQGPAANLLAVGLKSVRQGHPVEMMAERPKAAARALLREVSSRFREA